MKKNKNKSLKKKIKTLIYKIKNNKLVIIIGVSILAALLLGLLIFSLINHSKETKIISYDIDSIRENSLSYYSDSNVRIMDFMDLTNLFGISFDETENNALFIGNFNYEIENNNDLFYLVVINNENYEYYYDIFNGFLDSALNNEEDEELLSLYNNAILKKGKNYVYFIVNKDAINIEKEINKQIKEQ